MFGICLPNYYICNRNEKKIKQVNINLTIFKEMNKKLFFLAIAALGLAACSNDDVVEINQSLEDSNTISFRPYTSSVTRTLTDVTTTTMQTSGFYAVAYNNSDNTQYFAPELFNVYSSSQYRASTPHYWPSTGNLDFIAYYPNVDAQFTHPTWNTFTLTPADDVSTHNDYVVAATINQAKTSSSTGVPLHFKHLGSQIILKVYNSKGTANMKVTVAGWKIGYLSKSGTYTFASSTATASAITAPTIASESQKTENVPNAYSQTISSATYSGEDYDTSGEAVTLGTPIVIVPQTVTTFNSTSTYSTGGYLPGAFIGVKVLIQDLSNHTLADATSDGVWAVWPITNDWVAGTKYTYTIDLAQGGYKEKKTEGAVVEPWLDGSEIFFKTVDVTPWVETAGTAAM